MSALDENTRAAWDEQYATEGLEDLAPILTATRSSLSTDGPDDWLAVYRKDSSFNVESPISVLDITKQLYDEIMLSRIFSYAE